ncbi:MAG: cytochrome C [Burkholderiaceae bacterium]
MLLSVSGQTSCAQTLESLLSPGALTGAHQRFEEECSACHVAFKPQAQKGLCLQCHQDIGFDIEHRKGLHGRNADKDCRDCHTDHRGRDAQPTAMDLRRFDHRLTEFALSGAHTRLTCVACHRPGKSKRDAPGACHACHRDDDVHKGALGKDCQSCHTESAWREARFDHGSTGFALAGAHAPLRCNQCHASQRFDDAKPQCVACHRKDDKHRNAFGPLCNDCHTDRAWSAVTFDHARQTHFALRGGHLSIGCDACHTAPVAKQKLATRCVSCHQKDDVHKNALGPRCESCHSEQTWRGAGAAFDHAGTGFPLRGAHAGKDCKSCHAAKDFKGATSECLACHRDDDKHAGTLGTQCQSCHDERAWKPAPGFDHGKTRFPLRNAHASRKLACASCHRSLKAFRDTPMACVSCHRDDDRHEGTLGERCEQCHDDRAWNKTRFDHSSTRFPLLGRHSGAPCKACHTTPDMRATPMRCESCHAREDPHGGRLGSDCQTCHNPRAWGAWHFNHGRSTGFVLDGAHRRTACESCRQEPAAAGAALPKVETRCGACHAADDVHDRRFGMTCQRCHTTETWSQLRETAGRR